MKRIRLPKQELIPIGSKIRDLRERRGLTQKELARRVPITVWFLQKIESGRSAPTAPILKRILQAIDSAIAVDDVLSHIESRFTRTNRLWTKHKKIIRQRAGQLLAEKLDFEQKEFILRQLGLWEE